MQALSTWTLLLLLILQASVSSVLSQSSCFSGTADVHNYPLPSSTDTRHNELGQQVIVPQLRFTCLGYITSWSAHTLVLTRTNFIETLTHVALLQVWRPSSSDNQSYSRVGTNQLTFRGSRLRNGIILDPTTNGTAFFNFTEPVPPEEQILVQPGDVVGWFVPVLTPTPPLRPLFRDPAPSEASNAAADILVQNTTQEGCILCGNEDYETIGFTVPLVAATVNSPSKDSSCMHREAVCTGVNTAASTGSSMGLEMTQATTPSGISSTATTEGGLNVGESICIAIAGVTLVLHVVTIVLCAVNLAVMTGIKKALKSRTIGPVTPGVRSPSTFNLGPIGGRRLGSPMASPAPYEVVNSETPAEYEAVKPSASLQPPNLYEAVAEERRLQLQEERGSQSSLQKPNLSNSRTGSCEDLLNTGLK